jgi:hypothetical protein
MLKSILTGLLITMLWSAAFSQDVIRLTDGSEVSGKVTENLVGKHLRIRLSNGQSREIPADSVQTISYDFRKRQFTMPIVGYYNHLSWNGTIGNEFAMAFGSNLQMVNGWQWNERWMTGIGISIETMAFQKLLPIYADVRYNLNGKKGSAYLQGSLGYAISLGDNYFDGNRTSFWQKPYATNYGGITVALQGGYRNYISKHVGLTVSAGLRYQENKAAFGDVWIRGEQISYTHVEQMRFLRPQFGFGMLLR